MVKSGDKGEVVIAVCSVSHRETQRIWSDTEKIEEENSWFNRRQILHRVRFKTGTISSYYHLITIIYQRYEKHWCLNNWTVYEFYVTLYGNAV